jgi:SAM-dependent methyltransferase
VDVKLLPEFARRAARRLGLTRARFLGAPADLPKAWLNPEEDALIPPRGLWIGPRDPIQHYYRWIWEYLAYLTLLCDLRRDAAVLELGCGHGRTARGLLDYLRSPGRYCGLDVDRERLEDARERIGRRHPNFDFVFADLHSGNYHPHGASSASTYVFPFVDGSFDVIYAASLFTHLLPDETRNYFRESRRVLKANGRCLFSVFLLDHYRGHGTTIAPQYEFPHGLETGVAVRDPAHPDRLVGYSLEWLSSCASQAGLRVVRVLPGLWSNSPDFAVNEQDLVLLAGAT